jgi:OmpA-OmpF porin, OOP family
MKSIICKFHVYFSILILLIPEIIPLYSQNADSAKQINYSFTRLNTPINSEGDNFAPFYLRENNLLIFTSSRPADRGQFKRQNLMLSIKDDSAFLSPDFMDFPINSEYNEGCFTYSKQTQTIYFARDIKHNSDIYQLKAEISDSGIIYLGIPEKCQTINSSYWDSEPSVTNDGKTLYFASNRPGGYGKSDIWVSQKDENGDWMTPENLGNIINSASDEFAPFIFSDSSMLFFSSDGHSGFGGLDFFFSLKDETGWASPQNLEYLNSRRDELFIFLNDPGAIYYSTNKRNGDYEIYCAELQKREIPDTSVKKVERYTNCQVFISDFKTNQPISDYTVSITDKDNVALKDLQIKKNKQNRFTVKLPCNNTYLISIFSPEFLTHKERILIDSCESNILRNMLLYPAVSVFPLNIFFTDTTTTLNVYSALGLDSAYKILFNNPEIIAEIAVHTDSTAEWSKVIQLTWQRAESIRNYLIGRGISADRLKSKGYGSLEPIAPNNSDEGRKMNRRVELRTRKK